MNSYDRASGLPVWSAAREKALRDARRFARHRERIAHLRFNAMHRLLGMLICLVVALQALSIVLRMLRL